MITAGITNLLFPISARALKHNEKNDTGKNPCPHVVDHNQFLSTINDIFWWLEKQNERFEALGFPRAILQFWLVTPATFVQNLASPNGSGSGRGHISRWLLCLFQIRTITGTHNQPLGERKVIVQQTTIIPRIRNSIKCLPERRGFILILLALCCFALSPAPKAFGVSPAPDGGYAGGNTAEGTNALFSRTSGVWNTALGYQALYHVTTGNQNTATGFQTLFNTTTGSFSVANGSQTLFNNTTGSFNTATGFRTLYFNTTGSNNTGNGYEALAFNTTGNDNVATGFLALFNNTTGSNNTANGFGALYFNTTGGDNIANGFQALYNNTTGSANTATGYQALYSNTTGSFNTATGWQALQSNTTGRFNTANGLEALISNTAGGLNTATGYQALENNTTGSNNIALGNFAGSSLTTGNNNIDIGNEGVAADINTIRIGAVGVQAATFIAGIYGVNEGGTMTAVYINGSNGQLGTQPPPSSRRFKKEIKPMERSSEVIMGLKPVTFQYKSDPSGTAQFGLIAEEVAEVNPDLVVRDAQGEIYSVRYEAVNAMLLNEFLKEHRKVEEQGVTISQLRSTVAKQEATTAQQQKEIQALIASLKKQASQIEKVGAQLEMGKTAPHVVVNDQLK